MSNVAFYDDGMILLTYERPLKEARLEGVFDGQVVSIFKTIGDVNGDIPFTDISLVHSRGILCYSSSEYTPYEFNMDTRENKSIEIGQRVWFSSFTRTDYDVKEVFQDEDNRFTYTLDWDNKVAPLYETRKLGTSYLSLYPPLMGWFFLRVC